MDANQQLISLAEVSQTHVKRWQFVPTGKYVLDGRQDMAHVGDVSFDDDEIIVGPAAIQIKDWVFFMMRHKSDVSPLSEWIVSAFHGDTLHVMWEVHGDEIHTAHQKLCMHLGKVVWPILFDDYRPIVGTPFRIDVIEQFDSPEEILTMVNGYTLQGGTRM